VRPLRYVPPGAALLVVAGLFAVNRKMGLDTLSGAASHLGAMLAVLPPVFVLLGLFDVWVERERVTRLLGARSGPGGALAALVLGSIAAGPTYAAFPAAAVLLRKGSTLANALIFVGAWSTTKVPLLLFELSAMGWKVTLGRLLLDVPGVVAIAWLTDRTARGDHRRTDRAGIGLADEPRG
jgi:uncharacterized membrane protein YraQ (UPF0718 family)